MCRGKSHLRLNFAKILGENVYVNKGGLFGKGVKVFLVVYDWALIFCAK